jgi:hypothetical protein
MVVGVLVALAGAGPALALNNPPAAGEPMVGQSPATPGTTNCPKAARPQVSQQERARRKALRQQRAADRAAKGLPPKVAHQRLPRC